MVVEADYVDVPVARRRMRSFLAAPRGGGRWPGVLFYSDIFQLTGPMLRACVRLAGYGFTVCAPEIYHRLEPPGTVLPFDDEGRIRGLANARSTPVAHFDADCRAALDYLAAHSRVEPGKVGAAGFCLGGHLAFRAALQPDVRATACFYPTGVHSGELGADEDAGTLARLGEIRGSVLVVFGTLDPHVPQEGRASVGRALGQAGIDYRLSLYPAEHAFMRDEGPRYDPAAADAAFAEAVALFRRAFDR